MLRMAPLISFIVLLTISAVAHATSSERLYYASKGGYFQAAKNLIEANQASTAYKNPNGETALFAAAQGHTKAVATVAPRKQGMKLWQLYKTQWNFTRPIMSKHEIFPFGMRYRHLWLKLGPT